MLPYKKLEKSAISTELLDLAKNSTEWIKYYNFDATLIPESLLAKDSFFNALPPFKAAILRLEPFTCYDWHIDDNRGWVINMLLAHGKSHCLFSNRGGVSFSFISLDYEPGFYYAFNTQVPHTVLNFDAYRYLFSIQFDT